MSSVRIHRPKYALATMLRKPGGTTVAEAVQRAETSAEDISPIVDRPVRARVRPSPALVEEV